MIFLAEWTFEQSMAFTGVIFSGITGLLVLWINYKLNMVKETVSVVKTQVDGQMTALKLAVEAAHSEGALSERLKHDAATAARNEGKLEAVLQASQPASSVSSTLPAKVEVVNSPTDPVPVTSKK